MNMRRTILIRLLQLQGTIGIGVLLWIFFAGDRVADSEQAAQDLVIDTTAMAQDTLNVVTQKNYDFIVIKPSAQTLNQLATSSMPTKTTASEPPARDNRVSATIKVFMLVKVDDHYLLSGRDHWQKDLVCDDLVLMPQLAVERQVLASALVCRRTDGDVIYDSAGRSLQADIVDLEMPVYRQHGNNLTISML